ncbi:cold-regulated protein 27-like [Gastrolobium bilobum]|uniref:cold-regulated protein 27-like n=1 Tax=Gastrolobium bilobum TaxID=150636 RepID=UPI002AB32895|nr:cold-regulated protein 27-like [Gastrolobium bilobum]
MEEDLRRGIQSPSLSSDPESLPELTPTSSDSSAITLDNTSKDLSHHYAAVSFPDQSTRWTDQQHNLYLSSLEASFVNELHRSMRLRGWSLQNNTDEAYKCRTLKNSLNMPKQSLAIQDGCRKKISLERIAPILESTADSHVLAGITSVERGCSLRESNTYDQDLLCDEEIQARGSGTFSNSSSRSLEKQRICCSFQLESVFSTTDYIHIVSLVLTILQDQILCVQ